jgi:nucleotide-binding universal stress UspA family protein
MLSAWRSILLHVDATPASVARLLLALDLAERHDARITALFAGVSPEPEAAYAYSAASAFDELATESRVEWRDKARARLRRVAGDDAARIAWSDVVGSALVPAFAAEAAYADLLVLGAPRADDTRVGGAPAGFAESVVLEGGRPALVVPADANVGAIGRRALIAWNGSPSAARAVTGALPMLVGAEAVHVASWSSHAPSAPCSGLPVEGWLARHGVGAEVHRRGPSTHVGEELAALARRVRADLVVMGCYGRGRAREWVLGGATRSMLHAANLPLLLAH